MPTMKRLFPLLLIGILVAGVFSIKKASLETCFEGSFNAFWKRWLVVSVPLKKADALIVLGGESVARPLEAARLFHEGVAGTIFITGVGDSSRNRQILLEEGVPSKDIVIESRASTTFANAALIKPLLEKARAHTALIVTSPFHTRRALATFRKVIPEMSFGVVSASLEWWNTRRGQGEENRFAFLEFIKIAEYWLLHGVSPILRQ